MIDIMWISLFSASCYVLTLAVRKVTETALPYLKKKPYSTNFSRWWNQVILYLLPIFIGGTAAPLLKGTPLIHELMANSIAACIIYGVVMGSLSGILYKILKMVLLKKAGIDSVAELEEKTAPAAKAANTALDKMKGDSSKKPEETT